MSHQIFSENDVAEYLHLTPQDIAQRVKYNEIPFQKRGRRFVFAKDEIDLWASQRVLRLPGRGLAEYHRKSTGGVRGLSAANAILPGLIRSESMGAALAAKTESSVLQQLVELADKTNLVNNSRDLLASLEAREAQSSTGMPGGFALPHSCAEDPGLFEGSFIALGRTIQPIYFGGPGAEPTSLFFLICCEAGPLRLHILARLCLMARVTPVMQLLREATDAESMRTLLLTAEEEALLATASGRAHRALN